MILEEGRFLVLQGKKGKKEKTKKYLKEKINDKIKDNFEEWIRSKF